MTPPTKTKTDPEEKPSVRAYTDDELKFLAQLDRLPDGLDLTPAQVAVILSVDEEWLKKKRQGSEGAGPPMRKLGEGDGKAPIRYPLGDLRIWQREHRHVNTMSAKHASRYASFGSWMAGAALDEEWLFVEKDGRPVDALTAGERDDNTFLLTMDAYLERVRKAARQAKPDREKPTLDESTGKSKADDRDWGRV